MAYVTTTISASTGVFTSALRVDTGQQVNAQILIGSAVARVLNSGGSYVAPTISTFSGTITLQRQMTEDESDDLWRDVETWVILGTAFLTGETENITAYPEPETCRYRIGCKETEYSDGLATIRVGTRGTRP